MSSCWVPVWAFAASRQTRWAFTGLLTHLLVAVPVEGRLLQHEPVLLPLHAQEAFALLFPVQPSLVVRLAQLFDGDAPPAHGAIACAAKRRVQSGASWNSDEAAKLEEMDACESTKWALKIGLNSDTAGGWKAPLLPVPVRAQPDNEPKLLWAETAAQSSWKRHCLLIGLTHYSHTHTGSRLQPTGRRETHSPPLVFFLDLCRRETWEGRERWGEEVRKGGRVLGSEWQQEESTATDSEKRRERSCPEHPVPLLHTHTHKCHMHSSSTSHTHTLLPTHTFTHTTSPLASLAFFLTTFDAINI